MSQTLVVELNEDSDLDKTTADQLKGLVDTVQHNGGLSKIRLEVVVDDQLGLPLELPGEDVDTELEEQEENGDEEADIETESVEEGSGGPRLNPDTRRWVLASILYHSSEALQVSEIVVLSEGEEWEMTQSQASAELYGMLGDELVDRDGSPYEYQLTGYGEELLDNQAEETGEEISPDAS